MALKKKSAVEPPVPSSETVDAYKTYLQKAMPKYSAKDFAAGAAIPVDQVQKDILVLENKISQYKKFSFSCEKEEKQLAILKGYEAKVKGKHWPGTETVLKQGACSHKDKTAYTTATGEKILRCLDCTKTWKLPVAANYDINHKGIMVMPKQTFINVDTGPKEIKLRVGRAEIDQKFIMRMGMISNCNVSIVRKSGAHYTDDTVLHCDNCNKSLVVNDSTLVSKENALPAVIESFCQAHRHDAKADERTGRLFREDNE